MREGTTKSGFKFKIDERRLDDMEFMELLASVDEEPLKLPELIETMLGAEQKKKLYDHLRTKDGRVPIQKTTDIVGEIMNIAGEDTKNS